MAWTMKPAKRENVPLLIGIAGASGSGKTYSALRLATGMQRVTGGEIAVIDTEARRALHYADKFKFQHVEFASPFCGTRYLEALRFVASKCKIVIVDSMSHEHEGDGGHLAMHESELKRMAGDDYGKRERVKFAAWIKPAAERRAFLNGLQQLQLNVIFCFRAKDKIALVRDDKGKIQPVDIGWQPIAGQEIVFDMTALAVLPPRSGGVADWKAEACKSSEELEALFPKGKLPLDEATGERLAQWAAGGATKGTATIVATAAPKEPATVGALVDTLPPVSVSEWPVFKTLSEFSAWSTTYLSDMATTEPFAKAWHAHYAPMIQKLHANTSTNAETAYHAMMAAYGNAVSAVAADDFAEGEAA